MASDQMTVTDVPELWHSLGANWHLQAAAGMEAAAGRRIDGAGHITAKENPFPLNFRIWKGNSGKQGVGVWMLGVAK